MRICAFGDSFMNGTGDPDCLGWIGRIVADERRRGTDVTLYNLGVRGNTSVDIRGRWRRETDARLFPDFDGRLIFSFGVNDCWVDAATGRRAIPDDVAVAHTKMILAEAHHRWPVLMVGPPPIADRERNACIRALDAKLRDVSAVANVPYLPVFDDLLRSNAWMRDVETGDGAHPGAVGYITFAQLVSEWPAWKDWFAD